MTETSSPTPEQKTQFQIDFEDAQTPLQKREAIITQLTSVVTPLEAYVEMKAKFPTKVLVIQSKFDAMMLRQAPEINQLLSALKEFPDPANLPEYDPNTPQEEVIRDLAVRVRRVLSTMKLFRSLKHVMSEGRSQFAKEYFQARTAICPLVNELFNRASQHQYVQDELDHVDNTEDLNQRLERLRFELQVYLDVIEYKIKHSEDVAPHINRVKGAISIVENLREQK